MFSSSPLQHMAPSGSNTRTVHPPNQTIIKQTCSLTSLTQIKYNPKAKGAGRSVFIRCIRLLAEQLLPLRLAMQRQQRSDWLSSGWVVLYDRHMTARVLHGCEKWEAAGWRLVPALQPHWSVVVGWRRVVWCCHSQVLLRGTTCGTPRWRKEEE